MSKFTWPTRIVVEAEVIGLVDHPSPTPTQPNLRWGSLDVSGENRLMFARVVKIVEVDDQWKLHPPAYYTSDKVYVTVPQSEIRAGRRVKIEMRYEPDYQQKTGLAIVGQIVRPTFLEWLDVE